MTTQWQYVQIRQVQPESDGPTLAGSDVTFWTHRANTEHSFTTTKAWFAVGDEVHFMQTQLTPGSEAQAHALMQEALRLSSP